MADIETAHLPVFFNAGTRLSGILRLGIREVTGGLFQAEDRRCDLAACLLAGLPTVDFDLWLGNLIERPGQEDVDGSLRSITARAENGIGVAIRQLTELSEPAQLATG